MYKSLNNNTDRDALNNLSGLLMEVNYHGEVNDDLLSELENDPIITAQLMDIKKIRTKYRAKSFKSTLELIMEEFQRLKEIGSKKLENLLTPQERVEIAPLFRKFEELSSEDHEQILEDQELLKFMEIMKDKLDTNE
jgi:hypothetical protein